MRFNKRTFQIDGMVGDYEWAYEDDEEEETDVEFDDRLADHALVFLVKPYMHSFIQPVGFFPAKGAVKGKIIEKLLYKLYLLLEARKIRVLSVVSDGAQTNVTVWNQHGIRGITDEPKRSFNNKRNHPSQDQTPIYYLRDPPHLAKTIRNHILKHEYVQV